MKLVSGQLKFSFHALKSMTIISLSTVIVVTALTLILQKKKYPPQISLQSGSESALKPQRERKALTRKDVGK